MNDIHGTKLNAGDRVLVYAARYERQREASGAWLVDQTRPLPVADVPMARGAVTWDEDLLAFVVRYDWVCDEWSGKAGALMGGGEYVYERVVAA